MTRMSLFIVALSLSIAQNTTTSTDLGEVTYDGSCSCCWVDLGDNFQRVYDMNTPRVVRGLTNHRTRRCTPPYTPPVTTSQNEKDNGNIGLIILWVVAGVAIIGCITITIVLRMKRGAVNITPPQQQIYSF